MAIKRIQWPDLLKAYAIILVVIGHIVTTYAPKGYSSPLAQWIYSFHMPLFMMLSGMFFEYTLDKQFWSMLKLKFRSLIIPLFSWSVIFVIFRLILTKPPLLWMENIKSWLFSGGPLKGYWYLKCLFAYLVVGYVFVKLLRNKWLAGIVSIVLFICLPNVNFSRMMIVFFWIGYAYNFIKLDINSPLKQALLILISCALMLLCYMFDLQRFNYLNSGGVVSNYLKFLLMGCSASLFWILLFNFIFKTASKNKIITFLSWIGTVSLGIYCIHPLFYDLPIYKSIFEQITEYQTLFYLVWSFITIGLCLLLTYLILKSRLLSFLLLGKKYSRTA